MTSPIRIIETEDGSQSLYNEELNETYHSTHGALTESQYVFIQQGLSLLVEEGRTHIEIFEVGFGTGLNALLVQEYAKANPQLNLTFTTLEPYPISTSIIEVLTYDQLIDDVSKQDFKELHNCAWGEVVKLSKNLSFTKYQTTLEDYESTESYDLIFFDAFAPSKQAEMWEMKLLSKISTLMKDDAVFVTYCARGQLKRDLVELALKVETLPGPPGKKEMVRGRKS